MTKQTSSWVAAIKDLSMYSKAAILMIILHVLQSLFIHSGYIPLIRNLKMGARVGKDVVCANKELKCSHQIISDQLTNPTQNQVLRRVCVKQETGPRKFADG